MGEKIDYKKDFKNIYLPKTIPVIIDVPKLQYIMISGTGNPNGGSSQRLQRHYTV